MGGGDQFLGVGALLVLEARLERIRASTDRTPRIRRDMAGAVLAGALPYCFCLADPCAVVSVGLKGWAKPHVARGPRGNQPRDSRRRLSLRPCTLYGCRGYGGRLTTFCATGRKDRSMFEHLSAAAPPAAGCSACGRVVFALLPAGWDGFRAIWFRGISASSLYLVWRRRISRAARARSHPQARAPGRCGGARGSHADGRRGAREPGGHRAPNSTASTRPGPAIRRFACSSRASRSCARGSSSTPSGRSITRMNSMAMRASGADLDFPKEDEPGLLGLPVFLVQHGSGGADLRRDRSCRATCAGWCWRTRSWLSCSTR